MNNLFFTFFLLKSCCLFCLLSKIKKIKEKCKDLKKETFIKRDFYAGQMNSHQIVVSKAGVGKVSCALSIAILNLQYKCESVIFIGTAGSLSKDIKVGDVVVSKSCVEHDFDARPFVDRCVVFAVGGKYINADDSLIKIAANSCQELFKEHKIDKQLLQEFQINDPKVHIGVIASGDQFSSTMKIKQEILERVPDALCVEMEGAAVAQACFECKMKFVVVRVISDSGDGDAYVDFEKFCNNVAGEITYGVLERILKTM